MIFDSLLDIIKHTHGLGFIDAVKLRYDEEKKTTIVESIVDNSVVLYGKLSQPIEGIDSTIGLSRMGVLNGYLNFQPFSSDDSNISILTQERNGKTVPSEVLFDSGKGHVANYRFMGESLIDDMIQMPEFVGAEWDIEFSPPRQAVRDLASLKGIIGSLEDSFIIKTTNGNIDFHIGSDSGDRTKVTFANNANGTLSHAWQWPVSTMLPILKLGDNAASIDMSVCDRGIAKIVIDSGIGVYTYMLTRKAS